MSNSYHLKRPILYWGLAACIALLLAGCLLHSSQQPGTLTYKLPAKLTVPMGGELPGTGIKYESMGEDGAHVLYKGQQALKRKGDSLDWSGSPVAGVAIDLNLRVIWYTDKELYLVGTAKIVIDGVNPRPGKIAPTTPVSYGGPVAYNLAKGAVIPGSTITFEGESPDGARLGGVEGYAFRKTGDSIFWEGTLRDGVTIRLDLRVLQFNAGALRVGGLVTLWIG